MLNSAFHGECDCQKVIDENKVAELLYKKGFRVYQGNNTLNDIKEWLYNYNDAYTSDVWFEELKYDANVDESYSTIYDVLAREIGCKYETICSYYIGDYDGVVIDSGPTAEIMVNNEAELDYVVWWCKNFDIQYEVNGNTVTLFDFAAENEMAFCFLFDGAGELLEACAIDWSAGYDNVSNDIGYKLAELDKKEIFSSIAQSYETVNVIESILEIISQTKEVVF